MTTSQKNGAATKMLVAITGANQGLGYYAAQQMASSGKYHVLVGSRDIDKANKAIEQMMSDDSYKVDKADLEPLQIDVNEDESIKAAAKSVEDKHGKLDILMLNAGIAGAQAASKNGIGPTLRELYQQHYDTNVFGAAVTVDAFLPLLRKSDEKRIGFTSSGLASLALAVDPSAHASYSAAMYPIYRSTKTAMNMTMAHYARLLETEGFIVSASDPGYCATNLNNHQGFKDPRDGCKALIIAATGPKEKVHARMVDDQGKAVPW
ncbi:hypothetical protein LTS14_005093 [Recurvomyces mirabilis]|uniref:uncharacterized protein n=1 Tax=Recurvomyces mirabilis TaxID=574656 RepID=UPI002DE11A27|nr:hypothetical protein LTS14_005093 [Recurvomyces mirabilis]